MKLKKLKNLIREEIQKLQEQPEPNQDQECLSCWESGGMYWNLDLNIPHLAGCYNIEATTNSECVYGCDQIIDYFDNSSFWTLQYMCSKASNPQFSDYDPRYESQPPWSVMGEVLLPCCSSKDCEDPEIINTFPFSAPINGFNSAEDFCTRCEEAYESTQQWALQNNLPNCDCCEHLESETPPPSPQMSRMQKLAKIKK